jgi:hypothetical protein
MKAYFKIYIPTQTLMGRRGTFPCPAGIDSGIGSRGRLPGPFGAYAYQSLQRSFIEETLSGGYITLELDNCNYEWRIKSPVFAHWQHYLPTMHGKWARSGDEIIIRDAGNQQIYFLFRQVHQMYGRAFYQLSLSGRYQSSSRWQRIAKPLPAFVEPSIWYGLAIRENSGRRGAKAIVLSDDKWFTFSMPEIATGSFRGYSWNVAFVLLTGYISRGDLIAHKGAAVDYQLSFGEHWSELSAILNPLVSLKFDALTEFALRNREVLHALGKVALQGTCVDYDEKHVIIGDLLGAGIDAGIYAYSGECVVSPPL